MATPHFDKPSMVTRSVALRGRVGSAALVVILGAACGRSTTPPSQCLQFSADLMPALAGGLNRQDFRIANAWAVKSDKMIDSSGVKFPAYFLSADIIAPNGEAVVGTWLTTNVTKPGLIYSLSPAAKKYSNWAEAGAKDSSTAGITTETPGAKESITCVLNNRAKSPQEGVAPKPATP
jgi:hypothetical protein